MSHPPPSSCHCRQIPLDYLYLAVDFGILLPFSVWTIALMIGRGIRATARNKGWPKPCEAERNEGKET